MPSNEFVVETTAAEVPVVETVLAAIQADALVDAAEYLAEAVSQIDGE